MWEFKVVREVENAFKCVAANEDFLAHFPAQRLKLLLFFFAQNRSAPSSLGIVYQVQRIIFKWTFLFLHMLSCLLMWKAPAGISLLYVASETPWHISFWPLQLASCHHGSWDAAVYFAYLALTRQYFLPHPPAHRLLSVRGWNFQLGFMTHSVRCHRCSRPSAGCFVYCAPPI